MSNVAVTSGWHGQPFADPIGRTREYVAVVRAALAGERVRHVGAQFRMPLDGYEGFLLSAKLHRPDLPIYLAAVGPRSWRPAGEIADGWFGVFCSPEAVVAARARLAEGGARGRAGRRLVRRRRGGHPHQEHTMTTEPATATPLSFPFATTELERLPAEFGILRRDQPVARVRLPSGDRAWLLTRYADVRAALSDNRFSRAAAETPDAPRMGNSRPGPDTILGKDPQQCPSPVGCWWAARTLVLSAAGAVGSAAGRASCVAV